MNKKTVLVLAPHTDDGELACGATISKLLRFGIDIHYVAFSSCGDSLSPGSDPDRLIKELHAATKVLGIPQENVYCLDYRVRRFEENRQQILDSMITLNRKIKPDIVFSPSVHDIHQDHITIAKECLRAFKKNTILQYEVPWNNYTYDNQLFSCVDEVDVEKKIEAVKCYVSQKDRDYVKEEFIRGLLITHGVQVGHRYAEVFEIPRMIADENTVV
ncbi:MAG: PIG-L family deacetylase [Ruminococcus sp.]|nr:PIG-L family deacetylase [Ruminococcus sp.]